MRKKCPAAQLRAVQAKEVASSRGVGARKVRGFTHLPCLALACSFALSSPVAAWEFTDVPLCTVSDEGSLTDIEVTFDGTLYTLRLNNPAGWKPAPIFAIRFAPNGPFIQTNRYEIDGTELSVSDRGFGNVIKGLQNNQIAQLILGDTSRLIDLTGAFEPVEAFKNCDPSSLLSS